MTSTYYDYDRLPDGTSSDITITETLSFAKIK
jgi:hypothetical protein